MTAPNIMRTVQGADLPPLGWHGVTRFDPALFVPIANRPDFPIKPTGGLWTSPLHDDGDTDWMRWCRSESYGHPSLLLLTPIHPDPDATVFRIDTEADLTRLAATHHLVGGLHAALRHMWPPVDWAKAATDLDAIWLTSDGEYCTRFSHPGLYGWDCETVLWLQPRFTTTNG